MGREEKRVKGEHFKKLFQDMEAQGLCLGKIRKPEKGAHWEEMPRFYSTALFHSISCRSAQ